MTAALTATLAVGDGPSPLLDVDLVVPAATTVAVVGPNGAGKSTLLRCLAGLVVPEPGSCIRLDGVDVTEDPPSRRRVGYVPQDGALFPHLDVRDNVAYGLRARGSARAAARARAQQWLDRLEVSHLAHRRPSTLSGGQAQRVALARALAVDPRILLLDEPTASLDAEGRDDVRHTLARHLSEFAGVAVLVTHDPTEALALSDRILVLENGVVTQDADPATLVRAPGTAWTARLLGLNAWRGWSRRPTPSTSGWVDLDGGGRLVVGDVPEDGGRVLVCVPPTAVALFTERPHGSPRNVWQATVADAAPVGHRLRVRLRAVDADTGPAQVVAEVTAEASADLDLRPGCVVWVSVKASEGVLTAL